jgi:hypothetical protein
MQEHTCVEAVLFRSFGQRKHEKQLQDNETRLDIAL